jgi:hypothetical protein
MLRAFNGIWTMGLFAMALPMLESTVLTWVASAEMLSVSVTAPSSRRILMVYGVLTSSVMLSTVLFEKPAALTVSR